VYLKSLTLKGFKSFAQPTTFAFEPGVTCVVGPNGSGKSNVVDALAWVMGEQGAKTLRGGKMEDVIFAGTATKGPLGRAEVILTIDNADGALPIEYSEVTISRTLFRAGGSEYAINGAQCRLLDVQELLSDSGLGREMHVIVGQGQLDAVLHASPEERRGFIEEAAGILKHRRRKEKTLRKLEAMQANLTRLSDLAGEIRRQLKPLGQQAEIAREAASIAAIVRDSRARLIADEVVTLRTAAADYARSESRQKSERLVLQEQLDESKRRESRLELSRLDDPVDAARRTAFALESVQERFRNLYTLANQRLALLGQQEGAAGPTVTIAPDAVERATGELELRTAEMASAEDAVGRAAASTALAGAELNALDEEIRSQGALISHRAMRLAGLVAAVEVAASTLAAVTADHGRQLAAQVDSDRRRGVVRAQWDAAGGTTPSAGTSIGSGAMPADTTLSEALVVAEARVADLGAEVDRRRDEVHAQERDRDALAARTAALSLAVDQKDGSSALIGAGLNGIRGRVADHTRIEPGFETAIAAALGSLADALLSEGHRSAFEALAHASASDLGRVEIVIGAGEGPLDTHHAAEPSLLDGVYRASGLVTGPDGVLALLSNVLVADDVAAARAALAVSPDATIVTRSGDVVSRFVFRGGSGATRSRLELLAERDSAASELALASVAVEQAGTALVVTRTAFEAARSNAAAARDALRAHQETLARQAELLAGLRSQLDATEAEARRLTDAVALAARAVTEARSGLEQASSGHDVFDNEPEPLLDASVRPALVESLDGARARELQARMQLETARERERADRARVSLLRTQLETEQHATDERARLSAIRQHRVDAATAVIAQLPAVLDSVDRSVSHARLALAENETQRAVLTNDLASLRRDEGELRERLTVLSDGVHELEMQGYEKRLQLTSLLEHAADELGLEEAVLIEEYGPEQPVPLDSSTETDGAHGGGGTTAAAQTTVFVRAEQQARLATADRKLTQLGRVNPLALEEFQALEQRHRFLVDQLNDLTQTRKDLLTIIDEIDGRMRDIFAGAFEDTRAAFHEVFPVLFPGGTGTIRLTDPDNMLTTGIEVTVKPAGKRIERLSLLSGGERSLAAVALLIAIFKARPSPFYIMDEVEAALDDANLGRLLSIFEDLRAASQLIIITHQKRTMEIADALYGVSMQADGISAVVGQRMVHRRLDAAAALSS